MTETTIAVRHALTLGVRYHNDLEDRFQKQDIYAQSNSGAITGTYKAQGGATDPSDYAKATRIGQPITVTPEYLDTTVDKSTIRIIDFGRAEHRPAAAALAEEAPHVDGGDRQGRADESAEQADDDRLDDELARDLTTG